MNADWLKYVAVHHKEWVSLVRSWGEDEYAEDIVQEMYLKLLKYTTKKRIVKEGKVNKSYVWFTLRSVFLEAIRQKGKIDKVRIGNGFEIEYECELEEVIGYSNMFNKIDEEIDSWHWYDTLLFELYRDSGKSMRQIAKDTNISLSSIFETLKACKKRIKEQNKEDYEDYKNKDYERI